MLKFLLKKTEQSSLKAIDEADELLIKFNKVVQKPSAGGPAELIETVAVIAQVRTARSDLIDSIALTKKILPYLEGEECELAERMLNNLEAALTRLQSLNSAS